MLLKTCLGRARGAGRQGRGQLRPNMGEPSEIRGVPLGHDWGGRGAPWAAGATGAVVRATVPFCC